MDSSQIILTGITPNEFISLMQPMVEAAIVKLKDVEPEKLLSPAETCKIFQPNISKVTLSAWTKKGLLTEHRIGGRIFYKQSEVLSKLTTLRRYHN